MSKDANITSQDSETITFHYIKNPNFRVIHADGAIGGVTPSNLIHFALYSERLAIPQTITHKLNPDRTLGEQISFSGKQGMVREIDVDVMLNIEAARSLRDWLNQTISVFEKVEAEKDAGGKG